MADWTDGPEYAPTERPDVFVEPDLAGVPDLAPEEGHAHPAASAEEPGTRPDFAGPEAAPLDAVVPPAAPSRDPLEAFDVASTPMTSWSPRTAPPPEGEPVALAPPPGGPSAWGHAHAPAGPGRPASPPPAWAPQDPFPTGGPPAPHHVPGPPPAWPPAQVNPDGFPQPGPPPWQQPVPAPHHFEPVTLGAIARNVTPGVLVCLGVGAVVNPFSVVMLVVASVLAARVRYRRRLIGRLFSWGVLGAFALGFVAPFTQPGSFDPLTWYSNATDVAQLVDLALFVVVPLVVGDAMRRGEDPEEGR